MLNSIQNDVFNFVLIEYLEIESRIALSRVLDRSYVCINRLFLDEAFEKTLRQFRLKRITKILYAALYNVECSKGYLRYSRIFRLLKQIVAPEHIMLCKYDSKFRNVVINKCIEIADVSSYRASECVPKKWCQLLRRVSRKTLKALEDNPFINV
jgi:hypothetical protein